ncbi:hypothetical protein VDGL01_06132, partial [Verticillium dahliae]
CRSSQNLPSSDIVKLPSVQHESSEELLDFDIWSSVRVALRKDTIHAEIFVTPSGVTPLRPFGCRQVKGILGRVLNSSLPSTATCRLLLADHSALFHSLARLLSAGCSWDTLTRSSYPLASGLSHFPVSCLSRLSSPWRYVLPCPYLPFHPSNPTFSPWG